VRKARIAGKECAVARDSQIVRLVKTIGMKIDLRRGLTGFNHEHVVLAEVGDIHPPFPIEANAVANAAAGKRHEQFRPRRAQTQFSDRTLPSEIHDIQGASGVDGRSLDAACIFTGRRELTALEQRGLRARGATESNEAHKACQDTRACQLYRHLVREPLPHAPTGGVPWV